MGWKDATRECESTDAVLQCEVAASECNDAILECHNAISDWEGAALR